MANHMMIDLETLDTRPSAVVFQVGILVFKDIVPENFRTNLILEEKIYHLDILDQIMAGRTIDPETVKWWQTQNSNAWHRSASEITSTRDLFQDITYLHSVHEVGCLWANSPSFDTVIMRSLREDLEIGWDFPSFREDMDLRTLKRIFRMRGREMEGVKKPTTHSALKDCHDQFQEVVHYLGEFGSMVDIFGKYETDDLIPAPVSGLTKDT